MSKADRFKNLNKDDDMLSNLLGVQPEELTEEQQQVKDLIELVNSFQQSKETDEEAINKLLDDVKNITGSKGGITLTPSTEERVLAEGGNSRTNKKESKTRRMNMLFRPTAYSEFQKLAIIKQTSANDLMNTIVENVVEDNAEVLEAYDKLNDLAK